MCVNVYMYTHKYYKSNRFHTQIRVCTTDQTYVQLWEPSNVDNTVPGVNSTWRLIWQMEAPKPLESQEMIPVSTSSRIRVSIPQGRYSIHCCMSVRVQVRNSVTVGGGAAFHTVGSEWHVARERLTWSLLDYEILASFQSFEVLDEMEVGLFPSHLWLWYHREE